MLFTCLIFEFRDEHFRGRRVEARASQTQHPVHVSLFAHAFSQRPDDELFRSLDIEMAERMPKSILHIADDFNRVEVPLETKV